MACKEQSDALQSELNRVEYEEVFVATGSLKVVLGVLGV